MILTYKIKHNHDFSQELAMARQVAEYGLRTRTLSSKDVSFIGLKSAISNQILRKYSRNKKLKKVSNVNLTVPAQAIKHDEATKTITITCLKYAFNYRFPNNFVKINQIEINNQYIFVSVSIKEQNEYIPDGWIGVDRNTIGHVAVASNPKTGKVYKLGKEAYHIRNKYNNMRKKFKKNKKFKKLKTLKHRESNIVKNINHHISKKIVSIAKSQNCGVKLEKLTGIRLNRRHSKKFNYALNSWSFYQLQQFIEYKAKINGVPVTYVEAAYTSKKCSRCGCIGIRERKSFKCPTCGHVDHADVNASFNIGKCSSIHEYSSYMVKRFKAGRSNIDRDILDGSTDAPYGATIMNDIDSRTPHALAVGVRQKNIF